MGDIFRNTEFVDWLGEQRPFYGNFVAATQVGPPQPTPTPSVTAQVTPTPTVTPTNTVTPTHTTTPTPTPTLPAGTTEAYAYLASVVSAGGTVSSTASGATITFFQALFSNGLYTRLNAFWPFLGGTAASHAVEGKLNFTMAWQGGMTHGISGATGNGTNGYGNTGFNPDSRIGDGNPSSMGVYVTVQGSTGNRIYDAGVNNPTLVDQLNIASRRVTGPTDVALFDAGTYDPGADGRVSTTQSTALGLTIGSALSDSSRKLYKNGSLIASQINTRALTYVNRNLYFAAQNEGGTANWYNSNTWGFFFVGTGLSDGEVATLSTLINNYQTSLSRNAY